MAVILNLEQPPHVAMWRTIEAMARRLGCSLTATDVPGPAEIERAIEALRVSRTAVWLATGSGRYCSSRTGYRTAARHRLPAAYPISVSSSQSGGLVSYGA